MGYLNKRPGFNSHQDPILGYDDDESEGHISFPSRLIPLACIDSRQPLTNDPNHHFGDSASFRFSPT